ncbi:MAG: ABC transporter permease [Aquabacterium sp.]|uniref:ABC transporter permease n=1 Tax=Aquabacterium sp. TaxID=1872578 RepID=UPI0025C5F813|nr:ABC transporter permease [Aquabacterium sp.]MBI3384020.1 ABC transporter permease [Aquabacterium sp.]
MGLKLVVLWTDAVLWLMLMGLVQYIRAVRRDESLRATWQRVFVTPAGMASAVVLAVMLAVTLADSLHFRLALPAVNGGAQAYDTRTLSVLDLGLRKLIDSRENSYSRPLATYGFTKETVPPKLGEKPVLDENGLPALPKRAFPRLKHGGAGLQDADKGWAPDVAQRLLLGAAGGVTLALLLFALWRKRMGEDNPLAWRAAWMTASCMALMLSWGVALSWGQGYHVLGTDRTGNDILYITIKSIRTAFVIGSLATIATIPLALAFGIAAGYFKGWVDDVIQYIYTVLSSVPNILLIAACVLMMQVFIDKHPELFETGLERADLKIFLLCVILGVTGWAGLCRLLRAETLKLRELEYVQAATAFGATPWRIMRRHILPNVMHLVLITTVIEFSGLILYEAVLSYVGIGVDPSMSSFGGMINQARGEMSRDPVVWWSFASAFVFMVSIVLAANLFADAVRDAFDPRARVFRPVKRPAAAVTA